MFRYVVLLAVLALAAAATAAADTPPVAHVATTCDDYDNQADAQRDKDTRDADGDGIYCETLPCPCLKPGGAGGGSNDDPPPPPKKKRAQWIKARIIYVYDGDTLKVRAWGAKRDYYRVRLIGIDTPETHRPGTAIECGGPEATSSMLDLAFSAPEDTDGDGLFDTKGGKGRRVTLWTDPTQDLFDSYGRLLAYVDPRFGATLAVRQLERGWAQVYVYEKRFRRIDRFRDAEDSAAESDIGVWSMCGGDFHSGS